MVRKLLKMEREMGLEPTTSSLGWSPLQNKDLRVPGVLSWPSKSFVFNRPLSRPFLLKQMGYELSASHTSGTHNTAQAKTARVAELHGSRSP